MKGTETSIHRPQGVLISLQVLARDITKEEAREFMHIVWRVAAVILLAPELDKNYMAARK